jgi:hypothetical protein
LRLGRGLAGSVGGDSSRGEGNRVLLSRLWSGIPGKMSDVHRRKLVLPGLTQIMQGLLIDTAFLKVNLGGIADLLDDLLENRTHLLVGHDC